MTTPTEVLKSPPSRKKLIFFVLVVVAALLLVRFFVLEPSKSHFSADWYELLARVLESFSVALLTGLSIPLLAIWFGPDAKQLSRIQVLDRRLEATPAFETAFTKTDKWYFRGGMGSFFRAKTLPALQKLRPPVTVKLVFLDLRDQQLIDRYADYRVAQGDSDVTAQKIREGIISSIWALVKSKPGRHAIVEAAVHFTDVYSSFRLDLATHEVFLTQDAPEAPALRFTSESSYYKGFENEFRQDWIHTVQIHDEFDKIDLENPDEFFLRCFSVTLSAKEVSLLKKL
jgi:hypothetical protein